MALLSPEALAARSSDPDLRIVDVRWLLGQPGEGRVRYDAGHIPGAIFIDLDAVLTGPGPGRHPLPSPINFARALGQLGVSDDHFVVAYDDVGGWVASRLWWMLENLGHERVAVLDGGYPAWVAAGLPTTVDIPAYPPATLTLATEWSGTIDRDALRERLGEVALLDARAGPRYRGEVEPIDQVAGHIPGARNRPTSTLATPEGTLLPAAELAATFARDLGDVPPERTVAYCGSGVTACHVLLALERAGLPGAKLYPGSWSEWTRDPARPVARGSD